MNDDPIYERIPREIVQPVVDWMQQNGYTLMRLTASPPPLKPTSEPLRDESDSLLYCDEQPASEGLRDIFAVSDDQGRGWLNGPSPVPHGVLRPLLRALSEASVSEFEIAAAGALPVVDTTSSSTLTLERTEDVEEYERPGDLPVFVLFQEIENNSV